MLQIIATILALLGPFFFPWQFALIIACIIAFFIPPVILIVGFLLDVLYFSGPELPYFTLIGILGAIITYFVHQFVKTRIMG